MFAWTTPVSTLSKKDSGTSKLGFTSRRVRTSRPRSHGCTLGNRGPCATAGYELKPPSDQSPHQKYLPARRAVAPRLSLERIRSRLGCRRDSPNEKCQSSRSTKLPATVVPEGFIFYGWLACTSGFLPNVNSQFLYVLWIKQFHRWRDHRWDITRSCKTFPLSSMRFQF